MVEPLPSMLEALSSIPYTAIGKKKLPTVSYYPGMVTYLNHLGGWSKRTTISPCMCTHVHTPEYMGREREIKIEKEGKTIVYHKASGIDKA